jgi:hypothetical protein
MKKIFFFVALGIGVSSICICVNAQELTTLEKFAQRYAPPADVIELLEKYKELVLKLDKRGHLKEIPHFFIKTADTSQRFQAHLLHRVVNAERLRRCIARHGLNRLEVVKKYIYKLEGLWINEGTCALRLDGKWIVLAEKVNFKPQQLELSLQEVQQLAVLAEKTLYRDWGFARAIGNGPKYAGNNWVRSEKTGKLVCIDTEDRSFEEGEGHDLSGKPLPVVFGHLSEAIANHCDSRFKARRWLRKYKKSRKNVRAGLSLNRSREYDDPDLNFEEVKKEWALECREFRLEQERLRKMPPEPSAA